MSFPLSSVIQSFLGVLKAKKEAKASFQEKVSKKRAAKGALGERLFTLFLKHIATFFSSPEGRRGRGRS